MREIEIELHEAAANNKASVVKILLNNKNIDINLPNVLGLTPLTHAAKFGHIEIVKILLDAGADIDIRDYRGNTPLIEAIKRGYVYLVKLFIEYGADVNYEDRSGKKPLYYALKIIGNSKNEIVKLLVNEGATE